MFSLRCHQLVPVVLLAIVAAWPRADAHADGVASVRFGLGISGEVDVNDSEDDLDATLGVDLNYVSALSKNLSLGAGLAFWSWISDPANDADLDRNLLIDVVLRPEARFPMGGKVSFFAALPVGLTYSSIGDNDFLGGEIEPAFGYRLGFELGARFGVSRTGGFEVAAGLMHHAVEHEVDTILGSTTVDGTVTQFMVHIGAYSELGSGG